jgi:hypothetical protein
MASYSDVVHSGAVHHAQQRAAHKVLDAHVQAELGPQEPLLQQAKAWDPSGSEQHSSPRIPAGAAGVLPLAGGSPYTQHYAQQQYAHRQQQQYAQEGDPEAPPLDRQYGRGPLGCAAGVVVVVAVVQRRGAGPAARTAAGAPHPRSLPPAARPRRLPRQALSSTPRTRAGPSRCPSARCRPAA